MQVKEKIQTQPKAGSKDKETRLNSSFSKESGKQKNMILIVAKPIEIWLKHTKMWGHFLRLT
jgi:hypothetical protein